MNVCKDRSADYWWVSCRFKDINGVVRRTTKRGFKSEEEEFDAVERVIDVSRD